MTPVIYLASPIDQGFAGETRRIAKGVLLESGCAVFDPAAGWDVPKQATPNKSLQDGNLALLRKCDGMLAILKPDILTIGVILEIVEAHNMGMPISVYGYGLQPSWSLAHLGYRVHDDIEQAIDELVGGME